MKKYSILIKEQNLVADNLIIVDVQEAFSEFIPQNFVELLNKYCMTFTNVYQIYDINKADKSYTFNNEKIAVAKKYGLFKQDERIRKYCEDLEAKNDIKNIKEGEKFLIALDEYIIRIVNNHNWFYVNPELSKLFYKLKNKKCILVGGGDGECLKDVYIACKSFGIDVVYNHNFIYSSQTSDEDVKSKTIVK